MYRNTALVNWGEKEQLRMCTGHVSMKAATGTAFSIRHKCHCASGGMNGWGGWVSLVIVGPGCLQLGLGWVGPAGANCSTDRCAARTGMRLKDSPGHLSWQSHLGACRPITQFASNSRALGCAQGASPAPLPGCSSVRMAATHSGGARVSGGCLACVSPRARAGRGRPHQWLRA